MGKQKPHISCGARVVAFVLDLLFPRFCYGCNGEGEFFCSSCRANIRFMPPICVVCRKLVPASGHVFAGRTCPGCRTKSALYGFLSPFSYDDRPIKEMIHDLKYSHIRACAAVCADFFSAYARIHGIVFPANAVCIPIPLHKRRERVRGFNQAALFADLVAEQCGLLYEPVLIKNKNTPPQTGLSREARRKNLEGVFGIRRSDAVRGKTVFLCDDVTTTGATLEEAARALQRAGAKKIWAVTIAH